MISRILAVIYRNSLWAYRSPFRLTDVFLWPLVTLFTLTFFLSVFGADTRLTGLLIVSVVAWRALYFVTFETGSMFVEENWDRSLPNLLVTPITTTEMAIGGALGGVLKSVLVVVLCLAVGYFIYGFVLTDMTLLALSMVFMMLAGFSIGFVLFGMSCYFEKRNVFTLSFVAPELIALFSGPYYNIYDVFPPWLAGIINLFPTTHAFNVVKSIFSMAVPDYAMLAGTTVLWLAGAFAINRMFFSLGRKKGTLAKVG
ncbi:ABC transporter permease [Candidatus Micrarchaeota archaeon]|nr:ABC transporter permease [Candidatus Micrarchaeota archaeon]